MYHFTEIKWTCQPSYLEFLMLSECKGFENAYGTINFIHLIGKLFDLLNSKNPFGKRYKKPLRLADKCEWIHTFNSSIEYLSTGVHGTKLLCHRHKMFVLGFITAASSPKELALQFLEANVNPFGFVLNYKLSQNHLELLFACIRGKNEFNNNPDVRQFKSALGKILLRISVVGSRYSNCMTFENEFISPVYSLKWSRKKSSLTEESDDVWWRIILWRIS